MKANAWEHEIATLFEIMSVVNVVFAHLTIYAVVESMQTLQVSN